MDKTIQLFDEFIMKAITMTESIIDTENVDTTKLDDFTQNRERLLSVLDQVSQQIDWSIVENDCRNDLSRKIEYMKSLDVNLLTKLQDHREELKKEIEQTFKQKENIKGYNLNDVK